MSHRSSIVGGIAAIAATVVLGSTAPASASPGPSHLAANATSTANPPCKNKTTRTDPYFGRVAVYYCPLNRKNTPVELRNGGTGTLREGGYANWFVCQTYNYTKTNMAYTMSDQGYWGWVDAWAYAGTSSKWPLPSCANVDPPAVYY